MGSKHSVNVFLACILLLAAFPQCKAYRSTGRNLRGAERLALDSLPNHAYGRFFNEDNPHALPQRINWFTVWKQGRSQPASVRPADAIPSVRTSLQPAAFSKPTVVWFGHSSFLLFWNGKTILVDPVFNDYAGPLPGTVKAFPGSTPYSLEDLPSIDVLLISHDHYDHLDYTTVKALQSRVKQVIVPAGVGAHFRYWGYPREKITELAWHRSVQLDERFFITATPAFHRSNRGFAQNQTLWASYVLRDSGTRIYYSGDSGYGLHFKAIGTQYGPFDLALLECGQYNRQWPNSHMLPEQTARAAIDLNAQLLLPVHWARFKEAFHPWNEPVQRLLKAADSLALPVTVPLIGEPYTLGEPARRTAWWLAD